MTTVTNTDDQPAEFLFVVCQNGAETALRTEILAQHPDLNLAFSRPGFITFKTTPETKLPQNFTLRSTLARTWGWSLGKCSGESATDLVQEIVARPELAKARHIHVWQRDRSLPGKDGFEPGVSPLAAEIGILFGNALNDTERESKILVNRVAQPDDMVFDVIMIEPGEWWYGYHLASHVAGRWPGGAPIIDTTVETYSRAYFKLKEALLWSGIKIQPGDVCAEIGSAPGGACQLLLEMGAKVIAIDPAEMEEEILTNENLVFIRKRSSEVRKRDFSEVKWLISDMSVTPNYTLDAVEEIVSHESVSVTGLIMTMKLSDWKLVDDISALISRVRSLGFKVVRSRQLAFNRREFCMVAVRDRFALRASKKKRKPTPPRLKPKPKTDAQPEVQPEMKSVARPDFKSEVKPGTKPEA